MDGLQAFQLGQAALDRGQVDVAVRRLRHASQTLEDPSGALFLVAAQTRIAEALGLGAGWDAPAGGDKAKAML